MVELDLEAGEEEQEHEADRREHLDRRVDLHPAEHRWPDDDPGDDLEHDGGQAHAREEAEHERRRERRRDDEQQTRERRTLHGALCRGAAQALRAPARDVTKAAACDDRRPCSPRSRPGSPATRAQLHRLAEEVLKPARERVTGRFGLRALPGGFGTAPFGDVTQLHVDGTRARHRDGHDDHARADRRRRRRSRPPRSRLGSHSQPGCSKSYAPRPRSSTTPPRRSCGPSTSTSRSSSAARPAACAPAMERRPATSCTPSRTSTSCRGARQRPAASCGTRRRSAAPSSPTASCSPATTAARQRWTSSDPDATNYSPGRQTR